MVERRYSYEDVMQALVAMARFGEELLPDLIDKDMEAQRKRAEEWAADGDGCVPPVIYHPGYGASVFLSPCAAELVRDAKIMARDQSDAVTEDSEYGHGLYNVDLRKLVI